MSNIKKIMKLGDDAKSYTKKKLVNSFLSQEGITYHKSWGNQVMKGPHMVMVNGSDVYGCTLEEFNAMYVPAGVNTYRKIANVRAIEVNEHFQLSTIVNGEEEVSDARGEPGDFAVEQVGGELMVVKRADFKYLYELAE